MIPIFASTCTINKIWQSGFYVRTLAQLHYVSIPNVKACGNSSLDLIESMKLAMRIILHWNWQPGVVAHACNPAAWRLGCLNGLRSGSLGAVVLCRSGVHAKLGVNMGNMEESALSRLVKEERIGPGWKHSRQKLLRQTVVGSHLWIGERSQPGRDSRTSLCFFFFLLFSFFFFVWFIWMATN